MDDLVNSMINPKYVISWNKKPMKVGIIHGDSYWSSSKNGGNY